MRPERTRGGGQRLRGGNGFGGGGARHLQAQAGVQGGARADRAGVLAVRVAGGHPAVCVLRVCVAVSRAAGAQRHRHRERRASRAPSPA